MKKRTTPFGPGGKLAVIGLGGLVGLFLVWQFVIPFFFSSTSPAETSTANKGGQARPDLVGSVVDSTSGRTLTGATIQRADGTEVAKVDASGTFTITQLPADKDKLAVSAPGYEPAPLPLSQEAAKSIQLKPFVLNGTLVDSESQQPIANRLVRSTQQATVTDEQGKFSFTGLPNGSKVTVDLIGYEVTEKTVDSKTSNLTIPIRSTIFNGSLLDAKSGKPVPNAVVKNDAVSATTDETGKFHFNDFKRDDTTTLTVRAPGYKIQSFKAADLAKGVKLDPFVMHAIYVPGILAINANYADYMPDYWAMADRGEINAIVIGMKNDDDGLLWYDSQVPLAKELNLVKNKGQNKDVLIDVQKILAEAKKHNVYMIGRFVVMRDPALANAKPEWALKNNRTGGSWQDMNGLKWPNPFVPQVAEYDASLAKELATAGFDEVQYDYIRFPTDGKLKEIQYKPDLNWTQLSDNENLRTSTIEGVVKKAYDTLRLTNTYLSLDVFGMSLWREDDNNIGQQYNNLVMMSDYICPMVYPSHFDLGTLDQAKYPGHPGLYPAVIIEKSGKIANNLEVKLKPVAKYRPWLEDFSKTWGTPIIKNTPTRVQAQIKAAEDGGASGWTLWNATGEYTKSVLADWSKSHRS